MLSAPERAKRSPELAQQICSLIADGFSLRFACSELGIYKRFFMDWVLDDRQVADQYARAREFQMESEADQLIELADAATPENAHVVRLQVDTRKWIASKLLPKKYGDQPAQISVNNVNNVLVVSEDQRAQLIQTRREMSTKRQQLGNSSTVLEGTTSP